MSISRHRCLRLSVVGAAGAITVLSLADRIRGGRTRRTVGCDFADCSWQMRQEILLKVPQLRGADTRWHTVRVAVLEREWLRFDRYIVRDILVLFLRTDAWTSLGYEAWPGTPRGLERYTQAPSRAR
jgi:hypothetical protein